MRTKLSGLGLRHQVRLWPVVLVGAVVLRTVFSTILEGHALTAFGTVTYLGLLLLATVVSILNAVQKMQSSRVFWISMAAGFGLWSLDELFFTYYTAIRDSKVPDGSIADTALFLHVVPFLAALLTLPHLKQPNGKQHRLILDFGLLLFFWVFLYAYVLFPYRYLFWNSEVYNSRFNLLYFAENFALILVAGILSVQASGSWRTIYLNLLGACCLYTFSSLAANLAIDSDKFTYESLYAQGLYAGVCWFVWVPLRARELTRIAADAQPSRTRNSKFTYILATLVITVISLLGIWDLLRHDQSLELRTFRALVVIVFVLVLASVFLLKEYLANRDLALDIATSHAQLLTREEWLRLAAQGSQLGLWYWNEGTQSLFWDSKTREIFGVDPDGEVTLEMFHNVVHLDDLERVKSDWRSQLENNLPYNLEYRVQRTDGSPRWVNARGRGFLDETGAPKYMIGVVFDITDQKLAIEERAKIVEEAAHSNRVASMGQLVASLAHELAQPLAAILSNAQAALRFAGQPNADLEEIRGALGDIIEDNQRARSFIQSMRSMFERRPIRRVHVDMNKVVNHVYRMVRGEAQRRGIQLLVNCCPNEVTVCADEIVLQQVVLNLVKNGFDATAMTVGPKLVTITSAVPPGSNYGTLSVEDNGCGIAEEIRPKLFTPFVTTKKDGLGMGLAICRSLIESLEGRVRLVDGHSGGTIFLLELPLAGAQDAGNVPHAFAQTPIADGESGSEPGN